MHVCARSGFTGKVFRCSVSGSEVKRLGRIGEASYSSFWDLKEWAGSTEKMQYILQYICKVKGLVGENPLLLCGDDFFPEDVANNIGSEPQNMLIPQLPEIETVSCMDILNRTYSVYAQDDIFCDNADPSGSSRKRKRNRSNWQLVQRKVLKNSGQEYISSRGIVVPEKSFGGLNAKCCQLNCSSNISDAECRTVFQEFWNLGSHDVQSQFITGCIKQREVATHTISVVMKSTRRDSQFS